MVQAATASIVLRFRGNTCILGQYTFRLDSGHLTTHKQGWKEGSTGIAGGVLQEGEREILVCRMVAGEKKMCV